MACLPCGRVIAMLIIGSVAFRMNRSDNHGSDTLSKAFHLDHDVDDITDNIAVVDIDGSARCCCDAHQVGTHAHTRRSVDRTGMCIFFPIHPGIQHCADLGRHARTWQTGVLHHYTRTSEQRCTIDKSEVAEAAQALQTLHPNPEYCREVLPVTSLTGSNRRALVAVDAAPLNGTATVSCEAGSEPVEAQVTCVIDTVGAGKFSPEPTCRPVRSWCAAEDAAGGARVASAGVGQRRTVACAEGTSPEVELVTCGQDGLFHPGPACVRTASYDVTIRAAEVEASGAARCCCDADHRHLTGVSRWFTGVTVEHTGNCIFVFDVDHCKEVAGRNRWVHYRRTIDSRCVVHNQEYLRLNEAYPPPQGWNHEAERISD